MSGQDALFILNRLLQIAAVFCGTTNSTQATDAKILVVEVRQRVIGTGRINIDSSAAESVLPKHVLTQVELQDPEGSGKGDSYIAANGSRMPNLGEKKVHFLTKEGIEPSETILKINPIDMHGTY